MPTNCIERFQFQRHDVHIDVLTVNNRASIRQCREIRLAQKLERRLQVLSERIVLRRLRDTSDETVGEPPSKNLPTGAVARPVGHDLVRRVGADGVVEDARRPASAFAANAVAAISAAQSVWRVALNDLTFIFQLLIL